MNFISQGQGRKILLVHGLGGSWKSWSPIIDQLSKQRQVIAVDLPGSGQTPPLTGENSIRTLADELTRFLVKENLTGIDAVGSSMGGRLVLELARRGEILGNVIALGPSGFYDRFDKLYFFSSLWVSSLFAGLLEPALPRLSRSEWGRRLLLAQFSACPKKLYPSLALSEMKGLTTSANFSELLHDLSFGEPQMGEAPGLIKHAVAIGWGRKDKLTFPRQAQRARELFPDATIRWFEDCGHFPQWDRPREAVQFILENSVELTQKIATPSPLEPGFFQVNRSTSPAIRDFIESDSFS